MTSQFLKTLLFLSTLLISSTSLVCNIPVVFEHELAHLAASDGTSQQQFVDLFVDFICGTRADEAQLEMQAQQFITAAATSLSGNTSQWHTLSPKDKHQMLHEQEKQLIATTRSRLMSELEAKEYSAKYTYVPYY